MPIAPRYDQPEVQQSAIPNVRVTGDAPLSNFGGGQAAEGVASAIRGAGNDFMAIVQKEQQKADDTATKDALNKTVKLSNDLMYHPEKGAVTKQGKDAFGVVEDYTSQYDQGTDEIYNGLKSQSQRDTYRLMQAQYRNGLETDLNRHTRSESVKFEEQTFKALIVTNQNDAVLHYQDADRVAQSIDVQKKAIESHAESNGWDQATTEAAITEQVSKTHSGIIDQHLALGNDLAAQKYYRANKEEIGGTFRIDIDKKLEEGSLKGEAQRNADTISAKHKDLSSALAETKKIEDIKLRDETERRLEHQYAVQDAALRHKQTAAYQEIGNLADKTPDLAAIKNNPSWSLLSIPEKNAVENYVNDKISGKNVQTDRETYHEINQILITNRSKFMAINFSSPEYKYKLSENHFKQFDDMQRELKAGNSEKVDGFESDQEIVNATLEQAGVNPKAKSGNERERYLKVKESVDRATQKQSQVLGRKLNNDEIRKIAKMQTVQFITDKGYFGFFQDKKVLGELGPNDERMDIVVPDEDQKAITRELKARGLPVTKDNINTWYVRGIKSGG